MAENTISSTAKPRQQPLDPFLSTSSTTISSPSKPFLSFTDNLDIEKAPSSDNPSKSPNRHFRRLVLFLIFVLCVALVLGVVGVLGWVGWRTILKVHDADAKSDGGVTQGLKEV
ncbi:MAG: hypothetical protein Q9227_002087 [Pyrenula ochraceoflavens]